MASLAPDAPIDDLAQETVDDVILVNVDQVDLGTRLRPVDPTWASALGLIMLKEGQRTPIEVCREPGATRWTLVAGAHRLTGAQLEGIEQLRAIVVTADIAERRMREVSENLWRRDLEAIDRAAFIAELVLLYKQRRGIDPAKDGRAASVTARWQKAIKNEAVDANDTMSLVYGWSDDVADQLGMSKRTVERDLIIFRRIAPTLIARLRDARHPVATNATQLRALAKMEPAEQLRVVDMLLVVGAKSISDALGRMRGANRPADPETKRFSAVIGQIARMTARERIALFSSEDLHGLCPAEVRDLLAPMLRRPGKSPTDDGETA